MKRKPDQNETRISFPLWEYCAKFEFFSQEKKNFLRAYIFILGKANLISLIYGT